MAAHQNLASKIFSLCCKCCEKPDAADDSKIPNQTQELQLSKHGVQKDELNRQSLEHSDAAPCMSLGKATLPSEKTTSCFSSSEYGYQHVPDRGGGGAGRGAHDSQTPPDLMLTRDGGDQNSLSRPKAEASLRVLLPFLLSDVNSQVSKRGFHKRRLSRYSQDHWPYQPCLIGRP
ncbi:testis-expressed protein 48 [Dama dama]